MKNKNPHLCPQKIALMDFCTRSWISMCLIVFQSQEKTSRTETDAGTRESNAQAGIKADNHGHFPLIWQPSRFTNITSIAQHFKIISNIFFAVSHIDMSIKKSNLMFIVAIIKFI